MASRLCHGPPQNWHKGNNRVTTGAEMEVPHGPNRNPLLPPQDIQPVGTTNQCCTSNMVRLLEETDGPLPNSWLHLGHPHPGKSSSSFARNRYSFHIEVCLLCLQSLSQLYYPRVLQTAWCAKIQSHITRRLTRMLHFTAPEVREWACDHGAHCLHYILYCSESNRPPQSDGVAC